MKKDAHELLLPRVVDRSQFGMNAVVVVEARLERTPDGAVWASGDTVYATWARYLQVFAGLRVIARVREIADPPTQALRVDGPRVEIVPMPYYIGPWQFLRTALPLRRAVRTALNPQHAAILRVPGTLANLAHALLRARGQPYGVEVVGDPYDVFAPGGVRSILRPVMRWWFPRAVRRQVASACAARYVTSHLLQQRYPSAPAAFATGCSTVDLPDEAYVTAPRTPCASQGPFRVLLVGTLAQLYKGPDVLIRALAQCARQGVDVHARIVGDGRHRAELEELARATGVAARVEFVGRLPAGDPVRAELDRCNLFVMPSRTEGLPRAMIEAQARAVPCIGSDVGGIPELLNTAELVPPGNDHALAEKIIELARDPQRLARLSDENLQRARGYHATVLRARYRDFCQTVLDATAAWHAQAAPTDHRGAPPTPTDARP